MGLEFCTMPSRLRIDVDGSPFSRTCGCPGTRTSATIQRSFGGLVLCGTGRNTWDAKGC